MTFVNGHGIPKDSWGNDCHGCERMAEENKKNFEIKAAHEACHGWHHCGPECCGGCPTCGI